MSLQDLEPVEIATNMALGLESTPLPELPWSALEPRSALQEVIRDILQSGPTVVSFSGGRDSSALLAVATHVARLEGLPLPVPVTLRFPGVAAAQEDDWQELVVRHLRLPSWEIVDVADELDLLGPAAVAGLRRHGLCLPPQAHMIVPSAARASGGTVITGTGGDELLSPWRSSLGASWRRVRTTRSRAALRAAIKETVPKPVRRRMWNRHLRGAAPWLVPEPRRLAAQRLERLMRPARGYDHAVQLYRRSRNLKLLTSALTAAAAGRGARVRHPFLEDAFLASVRHGLSDRARTSRTIAMQELVDGLLPPSVLARGTKAHFNGVFWGSKARAFAADWDGTGVDGDYVDPVALHRAWQRPVASMRSWLLLQQAWLVTQGSGTAQGCL